MGTPFYMQYVVDRNVVMRRRPVLLSFLLFHRHIFLLILLCLLSITFMQGIYHLFAGYLSPLCRVFTITDPQQTPFVGYIVLQLFCTYTLHCK